MYIYKHIYVHIYLYCIDIYTYKNATNNLESNKN